MTKYLAESPKFQGLDLNGQPLAGGLLYAYEGGSTTPLDTYSDASGTLNSNPIVLDDQGQADVWLTPGLKYDFILNDANGGLIWSQEFTGAPVMPSTYFAALMPDTTQAALFNAIVAPGGTMTGALNFTSGALDAQGIEEIPSATSTPIGASTSSSVLITVASTDPFFANVVILAGNDSAANGTMTFVDQSSYARTLTPSGGVAYSTTNPALGLNSTILYGATSGPNKSIVAATATELKLTADFTIEFMVNMTDAPSGNYILYSGNVGASNAYIQHFSNQFYVLNDAGAYVFSGVSSGITTGNWFHVALTREANTWRLFVDGVQIGGDVTDTGTFGNFNAMKTIGNFSNTDFQNISGNMAAIRITNGTARYTSNFTPPILPLPTS